MRPLLVALIAPLTLPALVLAQPVADHLKCYKVKDPQAKALYTADLGGLAAEPGCIVKVPGTLFCTEATKTNVTPTPPGGVDNTGPAGRFLCYKVKCPKATLAPFQWHDQFGDRQLTPITPKMVCAPEIAATSTTTEPSTTTTTTLPSGCGSGPDVDGDGFTVAQGDCDDCDAAVNPGAVEVTNGKDDDCNGTIDDVLTTCDNGLLLTDLNPVSGAKAIDLCQQTTIEARTWGVLSAQYVRADGTPFSGGLQVGIEQSFGSSVHPQLGSSMLALSSGHARDLSESGACGSESCANNSPGNPPSGFPQPIAGCPLSTAINDDVALQVQVRVPTNAVGFRVRFDFYSFEYPEWLCTDFNDEYITLVSPAPAGSINGNVSFDSANNPISVDAFMQVCSGCAKGTSELVGTGFDTWNDAGATGWLVSQAPVAPGSIITVRFAIWDSGDQSFDSTVLLDRFEWITSGPVTVQTQPAP